MLICTSYTAAASATAGKRWMELLSRHGADGKPTCVALGGVLLILQSCLCCCGAATISLACHAGGRTACRAYRYTMVTMMIWTAS